MLRLVLGCMFSGKSSQVIRLARRYRAIGKRVLFVDHISDTRYAEDVSDPKHIISHDGIRENSVFVSELMEISLRDDYVQADVVIIEEAQFFPDLLKFVVKEMEVKDGKEKDGNKEKDFIVSGLSGDYLKRPIGDVLYLIPHAEKIDILTGLCNKCSDGTPGCFTQRKAMTTSKEQVIVGGIELYECVCRKHWEGDAKDEEHEAKNEAKNGANGNPQNKPI